MDKYRGVVLFVSVYGLVVYPTRVFSECLNTEQTMQKCMPMNMGGYELVSDFDNSRKLCRENKLQEAMSCLEKVYNDCASQNRTKTDLQTMVDPGKWTKSIDNFCQNADYLAEHEECQRRIVVDSSVCIQARSSELNAKVKELFRHKSIMPREQIVAETLRLGCDFSREVLECLMEPLEGVCPCRYQRIIRETVIGVMPPFCTFEASHLDDEDADCVPDDETSSDDGFSVDNDLTNDWSPNDNYGNNENHIPIIVETTENRDMESYPHRPNINMHPAAAGSVRRIGETSDTRYNVYGSGGNLDGGGDNNSSTRVVASLLTAVSAVLVSVCVVILR